jgi:hypothetical protein
MSIVALSKREQMNQIAKTLGRRVTPLPRGRPPKAAKDKRQLMLL